MYVPTISKAMVNLKKGRPVYEPFPWSGRPPEPVEDTPAVAVPGEPAKPPEPKKLDLGALTAKSMEGLDDEEPAPDAGPPATQRVP